MVYWKLMELEDWRRELHFRIFSIGRQMIECLAPFTPGINVSPIIISANIFFNHPI